jgi:hypothetical protein
VKRVAGVLVWFAAFWWLWMLLVGEWNHVQWIAATAAAFVATAIFELMRTRVNAVARVPFAWVRKAAGVPHQIFLDFGIMTLTLLHPGSRGVYRAHPFEATGDEADDVGARAWAGWTANFSPNAVALDIDREQGLSLVHDLVPNRNSEKPA